MAMIAISQASRQLCPRRFTQCRTDRPAIGRNLHPDCFGSLAMTAFVVARSPDLATKQSDGPGPDLRQPVLVVEDGSRMPTRLSAALVIALVLTACGGFTDPSNNQTETFTGTVQPLGANVHAFTMSNSGEFTISITSVTPGNVFLGVGYGQPAANGSCGLIQSNVINSTQIGRTALSGQVLIKGQYCVVVFDPSGVAGTTPLPVAESYTVQVKHP